MTNIKIATPNEYLNMLGIKNCKAQTNEDLFDLRDNKEIIDSNLWDYPIEELADLVCEIALLNGSNTNDYKLYKDNSGYCVVIDKNGSIRVWQTK